MEELTPVKIIKISSNDTVPLVYLPIEVRRALGLKKGDRLLIYVDKGLKWLVFEKVEGYQKLILERGGSRGKVNEK